MAMDFFEAQDRARRRTGLLVGLFAAAVVAIIAGVYLLVAGAILILGRAKVERAGGERRVEMDLASGVDWSGLWEPRLLAIVAGATVVIVALGSLYKLAQLRGGGSVVAERLGGRLIDGSTSDPAEQRALNVVEEMAIASGTPTPPVYILPNEDGINAFAAGYSPDDAVVGLTRGCVTLLDRDELQGVVAHEFSHIFNGDMRLNIRLIGVLHGILLIGLIGHMVLRGSFYGAAARGGRRGGREGGGGGVIVILAVGAGLMLLGFVGSLFGNLIKAASSRQREYLADASAVQFTRNPDGIGDALKKIGGHAGRAKIKSDTAGEASHMFFGEAVGFGALELMATHPPLEKRIRAVLPRWDGSFLTLAPAPAPRTAQRAEADEQERRRRAMEAFTGVASAGAIEASVESIGRPTPEHVRHAQALIERLPKPLREAARDPYSARGVVYAMLLDPDQSARSRQFERLAAHAERGLDKETRTLAAMTDRLDPTLRLPLIDLAMPALCALSPKQYESFSDNVAALAKADERISVFEWTLQKIVLHHLGARFGGARARPQGRTRLEALGEAPAVLVSLLAWAGHQDEAGAQEAFARGARRAGLGTDRILPRERCGLRDLNGAIERVAGAAASAKKRILLACVEAAQADQRIRPEEAELFRAFGDSIGCPVPPLLPAMGQENEG